MYLSRDAGATWAKVASNPHTYAILDDGAFMLMTRFDANTNVLVYSMDSGATWRRQNFTGQTINVETIMRPEGSEGGRRAVIRGSNEEGLGVLVVVDATSASRPPCRMTTDVETFTPASYLTGCLLGRSVLYTRRAPGKSCSFYPTSPCPAPLVTPCDCTNDDYECDFGYVQMWSSANPSSTQTQCVKQPPPPQNLGMMRMKGQPTPPSPTAPGCVNGTLTTTLGYQKIMGDTCKGGVDLNPVVTLCASTDGTAATTATTTGSHGGVIAFVVLLIVAVLGGGFYAYKNPEQVSSALSRVTSSAATQYRAMGSAPDASNGFDEEDDYAFHISADEAPAVVVTSMLSHTSQQPAQAEVEMQRNAAPRDLFSFE